MANDLKPPGVVLTYDTQPSEKARATVEQLRERWALLYAWGLKNRIADERKTWESWEAFLSRWDRDDPDVIRVGGQVDAYNRVERKAIQLGYAPPGPPIEAVGVLEATVAGDGLDKGIAAVEEQIETAEDAVNAVTTNWGKIVIGGAVVLGVVGVVGAIVAWKTAPYVAPILTDGLIGFPPRGRSYADDAEEYARRARAGGS